MKCTYNSDNHLQLTSACGLDRKDCAIAISYSGKPTVKLYYILLIFNASIVRERYFRNLESREAMTENKMSTSTS